MMPTHRWLKPRNGSSRMPIRTSARAWTAPCWGCSCGRCWRTGRPPSTPSQENATKISCLHPAQRKRAKPRAITPQVRNSRSSRSTKRGNLLIYHGAFAPRGRCHGGPVVVEDAPHRVATPASGSPSTAPEADATPAASVRPRYFAWAELLRRVFAIDILACPDCGGRLRLLATIEERPVVEKILTHLGLPVDPPRPSPARTPAWLPGVRNAADHEDGVGGHWAD